MGIGVFPIDMAEKTSYISCIMGVLISFILVVFSIVAAACYLMIALITALVNFLKKKERDPLQFLLSKKFNKPAMLASVIVSVLFILFEILLDPAHNFKHV